MLWQVEERFGVVALTGQLSTLHLEILTRFSAVSCLANSSLDPKLPALPSLLCETQTKKASTEFIQAQCIWNLPNSLDEKSSGLFQKKQLQILPGLSLQHYDTLLSSSCMHFTACYVSREAWLFDREPETYGDAASSTGRAGSKIPSSWLQTPSSDLGHLHNLLKAKLQVTFSWEPNWCPCWASQLDK